MSDVKMLYRCRNMFKLRRDLNRKKEYMDLMLGISASFYYGAIGRGSDVSDPTANSVVRMTDTEERIKRLDIRISYFQGLLLDKIRKIDDIERQQLLIDYFIYPCHTENEKPITYVKLGELYGECKSRIGRMMRKALDDYRELEDDRNDEIMDKEIMMLKGELNDEQKKRF